MKKKISIVILILLVVLVIGGITYAYFNYYKIGTNHELISGDIYFNLLDGNDEINITNIFPETVEDARNIEKHSGEKNNILTFSVNGKNDTGNTIYYQIMLNEGIEMANKARFNPEDLVFDLIEVVDNEEVLLQDAISYTELNNTKIWIDSVSGKTSINKTYKLRMWLSEDVLISDTDPNRSYCATDGCIEGELAFKNHYASVKVAVRADLEKKSFPSVIHTSDDYVENGVSYFRVNVSNDYLLEEEGKLLDENDEVRIVITNPENKLDFTYRDTEGNEVETKSSSLDKTYTYNKNKTITMVVYTQSKNDTNVSTTLNFKTYKNNELVQEYNKKINVVGNNYCLNNGFTKLADCILVTENLSKSVNEAKTYISSKGTPNTSQTAPSYTYIEVDTTDGSIQGVDTGWQIADSYRFDIQTGNYYLTNSNGTPVTAESNYRRLKSTDVGYYTFGSGYARNGTVIFKIKTVDVANNSITASRKTSQMTSSIDSEVGLYTVEDDLGTSYIFRGDVKNNNVRFGDYFWKIVRINGDGTIRMIFNGGGASLPADGGRTLGVNAGISNTNASGYGGQYAFNNVTYGPTSAGYMTSISSNVTIGSDTTYNNLSSTDLYYFGDDYKIVFDTSGPLFQVTWKTNKMVAKTLLDMKNNGDITKTMYTCLATTINGTCTTLYKVNTINDGTSFNGNSYTYNVEIQETSMRRTSVNGRIYWADSYEQLYDSDGPYFVLKKLDQEDENALVQMTLAEMKTAGAEVLNKTPYTCLSASTNGKCRMLYKATQIVNNTTFDATLYNFQPMSKELSEQNQIDSEAKKQIELWYENKFMNKLNNGNDVTEYLADNIWCNGRSTSNSGYLLTSHTYFGSGSTGLKCANVNDRFSYTTAYGNGKLKYPIALITRAEVSYAGGTGNRNFNFYLRSNHTYHTMTPSTYSADYLTNYGVLVYLEGYLYTGNPNTLARSLRPVINLKVDTSIMLGDGTAANPYIIE